MGNAGAHMIAATMARISVVLGPRTMHAIARLNKYVTNPVVRCGARRWPNLALVTHVGRRSGKEYRTPVMAFVADDAISVVLNYGTESDWVRNVTAAGTASVDHRYRHYILSDPRVLPIESPEAPSGARVIRSSAHSVVHAELIPNPKSVH